MDRNRSRRHGERQAGGHIGPELTPALNSRSLLCPSCSAMPGERQTGHFLLSADSPFCKPRLGNLRLTIPPLGLIQGGRSWLVSANSAAAEQTEMGQVERTGAREAVRIGMAQLLAMLVALFAVAYLPIPAAAQDTPKAIPVVNAARVAGDAVRSRFIADLSFPVSYNVYVIGSPYRVIVDLPEVAFQLPSGLGAKGRGLISAYRYGRLEEGRSRIVMDVTGPVLIEKSFIVPPEAGQPARMVVDLISTDPQTFEARLKPQRALAAATPAAAPVPEPAATPTTADAHPTETPASEPQGEATAMTALEGSTVMPPPASGTEIAALPMPLPATEAPPASTPAPEKPGGKKVIVLDPGHGGLDPGAASSAGTLEKDVVLALAFAMRDAIAATGRYEVKLTREGDTFVSLPDRVRFARQNRADLFIALHADSLRGPTVRGATVYTLSEKASDKEAEALAEKENRADIIAGVDLGGDSEEIAGILIDLAQRETKNASVSLAKRIVSELEGVTGLTGQPHRSAGFRVLRAPDVPSVLLEAGYLSSRQDEALLTSPEWRKEVAGALVEALDAYFGVTVAQDQ